MSIVSNPILRGLVMRVVWATLAGLLCIFLLLMGLPLIITPILAVVALAGAAAWVGMLCWCVGEFLFRLYDLLKETYERSV